jgi:hypothetical protein
MKRTLLIAALTLVTVAMAQIAMASHGGGGHWGGGGHSGSGGGHWGSGGNGGGHWSGGYRGTYQPHVVVRPRVYYSTPSYTVQPTYPAGTVTVVNPQESGRTINYTLGSEAITLEPGYHGDTPRGTQVITFDRGDGFGQGQYTLAPGTYKFVTTDQGLDLQTVTE